MASEPTVAEILVPVRFDADDVVRALGNNDELILTFVLEMLHHAGSSELIERLIERLTIEHLKSEG